MGRILPGAKCCGHAEADCGETDAFPCILGDPLDPPAPVLVDVILPVYGLTAPQQNLWVDGTEVARLIGSYLHAVV